VVRMSPLCFARSKTSLASAHTVPGDPWHLILPARRLAPHGIKAWQEDVENEHDGLVAKDNNAPYVGRRTLSWLKVLRPESRR
jgi:hypothetical protein